MILDHFRLDGKTTLVTGCKCGIGLAMAVAQAEAGADIIGLSATLESSGSEVERAVQACGRTFSAYTCDLGNREALTAFIAAVRRDQPKPRCSYDPDQHRPGQKKEVQRVVGTK